MRSPRVINALNEVINLKGLMMTKVRERFQHMTFQEALSEFGYFRLRYLDCREELAIARKQADILKQIIAGVSFFYEKTFQCNGYYPIHKFIFIQENGCYVCHRQKFHFENGRKILDWKVVGFAPINVVINRLSSSSRLASLSPMLDNHHFNIE